MRVDTPIPILWAWMFVTGLGVGPTFAVFILIVQASVPVAQLGTATSNLTFFQSVGGTVGLAITGTVFATTMTRSCGRPLARPACPGRSPARLAGSGGFAALTGVGDSGAAALASLPAGVRGLVEPYRAGHRRRRSLGILDRDREHVRGRDRDVPRRSSLVLLFREAPVAASDPAGSRERAESRDAEPSERSASPA